MVLPDVEAAVTAMVMRWQRELLVVQQQYGFDQVDDTMRRLEEQVDAVGGKARAVVDERGLVGGKSRCRLGKTGRQELVVRWFRVQSKGCRWL